MMVTVKEHVFSVSELAGSIGDWGTLIPFVLGYIVFCGFDPTGIFLGLGVTKIVLALLYKTVLPVQPKKTIGSIAIAERWAMSQVLGAGFSVGVVWLILASSQRLSRFFEKVPASVVRGIQLSLTLKLALSGMEMMFEDILFAVPVLIIAVVLMTRVRFFPTSLLLGGIGVLFAVISGNLAINNLGITFTLPTLSVFSSADIVQGFLNAGFAQLFLTITNAVLATIALHRDLFPRCKCQVSPRKLLGNMGITNVLVPFIGGMPMCHGAGGLAAQHSFGARTGGALLIEGFLVIMLGLVFSDSLLAIFSSFPMFILGVMLVIASWNLGKVSFKVKNKKEVCILLVTAGVSMVTHIALGFVIGLALFVGMRARKSPIEWNWLAGRSEQVMECKETGE
jgi:hypothetical protein